MFSPLFRFYRPGLRVGPDDVHGFNIDENGLPLRANAAPDGMLRDSQAQRYGKEAQTGSSPSIGVRLPIAEVLSALLPDFRVSPQADLLGFNVGPENDIRGFNVPENGGQEPETNWSYEPPSEWVPTQVPDTAQLPTPPLGVDDRAPPAQPPLPIGWRDLRVLPPSRIASSDTWRLRNVPQVPTDTLIPFHALTKLDVTQPLNWKASWTNWPELPTGRSVFGQTADLQRPYRTDVTRRRLTPTSMLAVRPIVEPKYMLADDRATGDQQASRQVLQEYQQRQSSALRTAGNQPRRSGTRMGALESEPERTPSLPMAEYKSPMDVDSGTDDSGLNGQGNERVRTPQVVTTVDLSRRDAAGLPVGTIFSGARSSDSVGRNAIDSIIHGVPGQENGGGSASADPKIHLVGGGDRVEGLPRNDRHQLGVDASIADHFSKGFEIVDRGPRAVDIPGFPTPRFYDYIIRDPVTGRYYGVEVKTTLMSTIRLDRRQVEKDAVVVAQGAKVRILSNVELTGVSYSVYCFGCEAFDVRSAVLIRMLQIAGVPVVPGILPGDIRP